jgi:hypothetical protein
MCWVCGRPLPSRSMSAFADVLEMISGHTPTLKRVELPSALLSSTSSAAGVGAQDADQRH